MEDITHQVVFIFYQINTENKEIKLFLNDIKKKLKNYDSKLYLDIGDYDARMEININYKTLLKVVKLYHKYYYLSSQKFDDSFCMYLDIR